MRVFRENLVLLEVNLELTLELSLELELEVFYFLKTSFCS